MKILLSSFFIAIILIFYHFHTSNIHNISTHTPLNKVVMKNCHLYGFDSLNITCGEYIKSSATGDDIKVSFALIEPDLITHGYERHIPVVYLDGGPGWGDAFSFDNMVFWQDFLSNAKLDRPLILFNPIGTQGSSFNNHCDKWKEQHALNLTSASKQYLKTNEKKEAEALERCLTNIDNKQIFSSKYQYKILSELLAALNFHQWHLWGSSYGSRLALVGGFDIRVKSLVLDSPYLFSQGSKSHTIELYVNAFLLHEKKFVETNFVNANDNFFTLFLAAAYAVEKNHVFVSLPNRLTKPTFVLNDFRLLITPKRLYELAFFSLYSVENTQNFYQFLADLSKIKIENESIYISNNTFFEQFVNTNTHNSFNALTYTITECMDNISSSSEEIKSRYLRAKETALNLVEPSYFEQFDRLISRMFVLYETDIFHNICNDEKKYAPYKVHAIDYPLKPMLFLVGEYDPVTPAYALTQLPQSGTTYKYIAANAGHGVLFNGFCNSNLLRDFLKQPVNIDNTDIEKSCSLLNK